MSAPRVSFEFFPPQSLEAGFRLWDTAQKLATLEPEFVSVTYGAGGSTRALTHDAVKALHKHFGLNVAAHLTCVGDSREDTLRVADGFAEVGVREIVALRGDPPRGEGGFTPRPDGFANSCDLISALAQTGRFRIRVGAYPDPHPEARAPGDDVRWLKRKFAAGAHSAITQFFFEADTFFRFRDACEKEGITGQIIPGILPIDNWAGVRKFARNCGAHVPAWLDDAFETARRDQREDLLAVSLATELCTKLIEGGVGEFHFYTLNKAALTRDVCHALGVQPCARLEKVA
ncbi:5,10-methylenetetrahydrofolate reductase (NAD(P)) [Rhodovulum imhoffii]|uniref:Methylenetetrahydrofolate reductase n=1 Tax=Rhodovulum imhoffii TaxID=365340 RepID=A0A2T5BW87_9RHOB|nr:methylenetetrahydrofolate reductase [NAD(P)H] [Rhodovulum imhoffii]MBK5935119.1 methylenetetrahydrofolate reductase [NAD(P)H] [Rhodovulum imhoffii]PTN03916.1 5,10-methylenetetrahydrofolate reductase (NAD(P)) [Rhodovulum imhoffii]